MATNPLVTQGTLNRVRCSIIVPNYTTMNIASYNMGKTYATIEFDTDYVHQHETATGVVNSPEPYVMATISVGILRTQALADVWLTQAQTTSVLGPVTIHSDTSAFSAIPLTDAVIRKLDPGAFDGTDPVAKLTLRGVFYINNDLWTMA